MEIKVEIANLKEVEAAMKAAGIRAEQVLEAAVTAGAEVIQRHAVSNAPGPDIAIATKKERQQVESRVGPTEDKWYWRFQELGTTPHQVKPRQRQALHGGGDQFSAGHTVSGVKKRPFLRPAVDENQAEITAATGKPIKEALERGG